MLSHNIRLYTFKQEMKNWSQRHRYPLLTKNGNTLLEKMGKKFVTRKKAGFNTPIGHWIAEDKNFSELTYSLLGTNFIKALVKKEYIDDLMRKHKNCIEDNSFKIFNLIVLSQWIKNKNIN